MMSRPAWLVAKRSCRASSSRKAASGSMPTRASNGLSSFRMRPLGTARIRGSLGDKAQGLRRLQVSKAAGRLPGSLIALEGGSWYGDFSPQLPPPFDMRDGRWQRGALDLVMHLHYILRPLRRRHKIGRAHD